MAMLAYNPDEKREIPQIGVPTVGIPELSMVNAFGRIYSEDYEVVETDEPNLLWENGSGMVWEDGDNVLLEEQKMRIWRKARG